MKIRKRLVTRAILTRATACTLLVGAGNGWALQFDTCCDDLDVRWDNTLKYNLMLRTEKQSDDVVASKSPALYDDGDLGFSRGVVSNRLDLLSEFELVWRRDFGFRISAAAWYDHAYRGRNDHPGVNKRYRINGNYTDTWYGLGTTPGKYLDETERFHYRGGELLDAFVFANFKVGSTELSARLGRHALYWGQSLFVGGAVNGIAGSMAPIDLSKGLGVPGSEARELFLPTNKLSASWQFTPNLALVGYYSFEFEPTRYPYPGSYLALSEISMDHAEFLTLIPGQIDPGTGALVSAPRTGFVRRSSEKPHGGEFGLGLQYVFPRSGLELGVYYLNYHDKYPQGLVGALNVGQFATARAAAGDPLATGLVNAWPLVTGGGSPDPFGFYTGGGYPAIGIGQFKWTYRKDNELFGISLGKEIAGISFGMDLVYRRDVAINFGNAALLHTSPYPYFGPTNQPLVVGTLLASGFQSDNFDFARADENHYPGPTGDTWHVVVNALGFLDPNSLWDGGSYAVELTFSALDRIRRNPALVHPDVHKNRVLSTIAMSFAPQWYQVLPSLDVRLPFTVSYGIDGQTPISTGGNEGIGSGSLGVALEYAQVWNLDLRYNFYFGSQDNGPVGNLKDRDNISFTIKRTF